jgi:eukaryotic-like serine/threonine-protein kinase
MGARVRYGAFLSYSHADESVARWLHRRLEGYRVPSRLVGTAGKFGVIPARLGAIFRDRDELPTAADLGNVITTALESSAALVVVCSPAAARSRWVNAEIEAFKATGRGERIYCFVVAGDPGNRDASEACFPPALLAADALGGSTHEPLAADARASGDGRERAFLRLVAGLLGVGFNDLAQREAQRRHRRLAITLGASLAITALALGLAISASVARNDAQRRQAQAEDILGFMLGDLRDKLRTVGRLDLMRVVDDKATRYFAALDPRDLSDRALEEQARLLTGMGEVRLDEGNHDEALAAFHEAHARSTQLHERDPGNGPRLFDLAQAEYWIAFVALQQGDLTKAGEWMRRYRDSTLRLAEIDPSNFEWQKEKAYGHHNLAVLDERLGRYAEAEQALLAERELYRRWLEERPTDLELRFEAANVSSWLGSLAMRQGRLADAGPLFAEQADAMRRNAAEQPLVVRWQEYLVDAWLLLADTQAARGHLPEAQASVEQARVIAEALSALDSSNNYWRLSVGRVLWWQAWFAMRQGTATPATAQEAAEVLGEAHSTEPRNRHVLNWLIRTRHLQAEEALTRGDLRRAREHLVAARTLVEPEWRTAPDEMLRIWLARTRVLQGRIELREGDVTGATSAFVEARDLVLDNAATEVPFPRLDVLVRALRLLGQAEPAASHLQRLERAGFVPLYPFPEVVRTVSGYPAGGADAPVSAQSTGRAPSSREQTSGSMPTR